MGQRVKLKTKDYLNLHDITVHWANILDLHEWSFIHEKIDPDSVTYDDDIPDEHRYCVGVESNRIGPRKIATIYYDRQLTERDIIHELLHVKYPKWTEEHVNQVEELLYKIKQK